MNCDGICSKYVVKKPTIKSAGRYESGHKRCSFCEVYLIWNGRNCPCCGTALRTKPRNSRGRSKIIQNQDITQSNSKK